MKQIISILFTLLIITYVSCTIKGYDTARLSTDFKTEGFIDSDHFQIVVKGYPGKEKRGLISKRESALENAKERLNNTAIEKLSEYYLNCYFKKMGIKDRESILNQREKIGELRQIMTQYLKYGYTAFEYYNKDNSAILVHRIIKSGLKSEIESLSISFKMKNNK